MWLQQMVQRSCLNFMAQGHPLENKSIFILKVSKIFFVYPLLSLLFSLNPLFLRIKSDWRRLLVLVSVWVRALHHYKFLLQYPLRSAFLSSILPISEPSLSCDPTILNLSFLIISFSLG